MKGNIVEKVKKYLNLIINSELFIILLGIVLFLKMFFFYKQTIYVAESIEVQIISRTFIFSMFVVTFLFLLPNRTRFIVGTLLNLLLSILMLGDNVYYNYSTGLLSVAQISNLQYSGEIGNAIGNLLSIGQIVYFIDILLMCILFIIKFIKLEKIKGRKFKPAIVYIVVMIIIFGSTIPTYISGAEEIRYNKKMQLENGTLYAFHYLDFKTNMNLKKTAKYTSKDEMMKSYNELKDEYDKKYDKELCNLSGLGEQKNVILLQLESYQDFLVNKKINGKEITPNINKFLNENIRVNNMIIQSYATTADSEHSAINSLYPLENGMAFAQYSSNKYDNIFDEYKNAGYYTIYMHGNVGTFWNRNNVYANMGVDEVDFLDSFDDNSLLINEWLSDEELYKQGVQKLKEAEQKNGKFFANIVAASCHTAFDLPGLENKYDKVNIDVGKYKGTYFGNYLEASNYGDYAFGVFIDELKKNGLYDDTVIFIFGDHYGMQMYNLEMLDFIENTDHQYNMVESEINYAKVGCGIKIPGVSHMEINETKSKLDIKPTLACISGIDDGFSLGTNMCKNKNFACLSNGIIVVDKYYYNGEWYRRTNGEKINLDETSADERELLNYYKKCMEEEITISNSVVLNNLLQ